MSVFQTYRVSLRKNAFVISSCLVAFALPFSIELTTKAIILMAIAWLFQKNFSSLLIALKSDKVLWVFISLYLLMVVALIYTKDFGAGMWELEKGLCLLVFPILFVSTNPIPRDQVYWIVKAFILSNICFGLISLGYAAYLYAHNGTNIFFHHDLVTPLFESHATYYSIYIIFSLVAVLFFYFKEQQPTVGHKFLTGAIIIFFSVLIYLLSVRSIIIFFSLAVFIGISIYSVKSKNWKMGVVIFISFGLIAYFVSKNNPVLLERLSQITENYDYKMSEETMEGYNGFTTRLAQWQSSLSIIKEHPIIGVAPADVQDELQKMYQRNFLKYCYLNRWNAHNQYLQTTLGLGFVGLFIFLAGLVTTATLAVKQRNVLGITFIALFAFCSITESTLCVQKGIAFYSFFQSLIVFHLLKKHAPTTTTT